MTTKSGKHANKIAKNAFDSAANNGVAKAVDMRKVAALSAGAAGVIAGAAIAFGATPAMAADATSTPVDTSKSANAQDVTANKKKAEAEDSKKTATDTTKKEEAKKEQPEQTKPAEQTVVKAEGTETNKHAADNTPAPNSVTSKVSTYAASNTPAEAPAGPNYGQVREATPAPAPKVNSEITLSKEKKRHAS